MYLQFIHLTPCKLKKLILCTLQIFIKKPVKKADFKKNFKTMFVIIKLLTRHQFQKLNLFETFLLGLYNIFNNVSRKTLFYTSKSFISCLFVMNFHNHNILFPLRSNLIQDTYVPTKYLLLSFLLL